MDDTTIHQDRVGDLHAACDLTVASNDARLDGALFSDLCVGSNHNSRSQLLVCFENERRDQHHQIDSE